MSLPPPLPDPSFLQRPAGSDPEIRVWVSLAQERVAALHAALAAATARAEAAERRLRDFSTGSVGVPALERSDGVGDAIWRAEPGSAAAAAQARFQAAAEAATAVMAEARAVLREAREATAPLRPLMLPGTTAGDEAVAAAADSPPSDLGVSKAPAPIQPPAGPADPPTPAADGVPPDSLEPRPEAADDRAVVEWLPQSGSGAPIVLGPSSGRRHGLIRRLGRRLRRQ